MKAAATQHVTIDGHPIEYRIALSKTAKKLRVRVGPGGVEVVKPQARDIECINDFLLSNGPWILDQLKRIEQFKSIRRPRTSTSGTILFRGDPIPVLVELRENRKGANQVRLDEGRILITRTGQTSTPPAKSLENWLRKQARDELLHHLEEVLHKLKRRPGRVFVRGQRTKWGNCSSRQNLSFNWRLIMAPDFVLRYMVTHEAVHLAIPDHSHRFWLTVQSLCPETERAKQWLCANAHDLVTDLRDACPE